MEYIRPYRIFESEQTFTVEMAQEIAYYFTEDGNPTQEILNDFYNEFGDNDEFVYYEAGYDDIKGYINILLEYAKTPELSSKLINIYNKIREERKDFPKVSDIEDIFLDVIETENMSLMISSDRTEYKIKLSKRLKNTSNSLQEFIKYCNSINKSIKKLESSKYHTYVGKSEMSQGYQTIDGKADISSHYVYFQFIIYLTK